MRGSARFRLRLHNVSKSSARVEPARWPAGAPTATGECSRSVVLRSEWPASSWVAMAGAAGPQVIVRDRDDKFGADFDPVAKGVGIRVGRTAARAPLMTPYTSDSWVAFGVNASTTSSSSERRTFRACSTSAPPHRHPPFLRVGVRSNPMDPTTREHSRPDYFPIRSVSAIARHSSSSGIVAADRAARSYQ